MQQNESVSVLRARAHPDAPSSRADEKEEEEEECVARGQKGEADYVVSALEPPQRKLSPECRPCGRDWRDVTHHFSQSYPCGKEQREVTRAS